MCALCVMNVSWVMRHVCEARHAHKARQARTADGCLAPATHGLTERVAIKKAAAPLSDGVGAARQEDAGIVYLARVRPSPGVKDLVQGFDLGQPGGGQRPGFA